MYFMYFWIIAPLITLGDRLHILGQNWMSKKPVQRTNLTLSYDGSSKFVVMAQLIYRSSSLLVYYNGLSRKLKLIYFILFYFGEKPSCTVIPHLLQQTRVKEAHNVIVTAVLGDVQRCFVAVAQCTRICTFSDQKRDDVRLSFLSGNVELYKTLVKWSSSLNLLTELLLLNLDRVERVPECNRSGTER